MNKIFLVPITACFLFITSCDQKKTEAKLKEAQSEDSTKTETVVGVPKPQLTGKAFLVARQWNASEFETSNVKLSGELIDLKYDFKSDNTFDYTSDGKNESGVWSINEEGTKLKLRYNTEIEVDYDIKQLSEDLMIIAGKEHEMFRIITLAPQKK